LVSFSSRTAGELAPSTGRYLVVRKFTYTICRGDILRGLASRYGVALSALTSANQLKLDSILRPGEILQIDNLHVVPQRLTDGIIVNSPQRLLFLFQAGNLITSYPVALGRPDWPTPTGDFKITAMQQDPPWIVPASIQREMAKRGEKIVAWVAPGSHNPLTLYAIFLNAPGYLIHGTDRPSSIYHFRSHGCLRLGSIDITSLFNQVSSGEPVKIIYPPLSVACLPDGQIFLEVDRDAYHQARDPFTAVQVVARTAHSSNAIAWPASG
jgi:L,D-transpeptidase ErfK/SrfK